MVEREDQRLLDSEKAAIILRDNLVSHPATGLNVATLSRRFVSFRNAFDSAQTPLAILAAVTRYSREEDIRVLEDVVDVWVNSGNNKNRTSARIVISSDLEAWRAGR